MLTHYLELLNFDGQGKGVGLLIQVIILNITSIINLLFSRAVQNSCAKRGHIHTNLSDSALSCPRVPLARERVALAREGVHPRRACVWVLSSGGAVGGAKLAKDLVFRCILAAKE